MPRDFDEIIPGVREPELRSLTAKDKFLRGLRSLYDVAQPAKGDVTFLANPMGMVLNSKTIDKFEPLLKATKEYLSAKYPGLAEKNLNAMSFVRTRYPSFFDRMMEHVAQITENNKVNPSWHDSSSVLNLPSANFINPGTKQPVNKLQSVIHELRHIAQFREPRYARGKEILGPFPANHANTISQLINTSGTAGNYKLSDSLFDQYKQLPYELDPYRVEDLIKDAETKYLLLSKRAGGSMPDPRGTFKPSTSDLTLKPIQVGEKSYMPTSPYQSAIDWINGLLK